MLLRTMQKRGTAYVCMQQKESADPCDCPMWDNAAVNTSLYEGVTMVRLEQGQPEGVHLRVRETELLKVE